MADHFKAVERITGKKPEALELPDLPIQLSHLWNIFCELHRGRPSGFNGPEPITYRQILDWKEVTEGILSHRDVATILKLDKVYEEVMNQNG